MSDFAKSCGPISTGNESRRFRPCRSDSMQTPPSLRMATAFAAIVSSRTALARSMFAQCCIQSSTTLAASSRVDAASFRRTNSSNIFTESAASTRDIRRRRTFLFSPLPPFCTVMVTNEPGTSHPMRSSGSRPGVASCPSTSRMTSP